MMTKPKNEKKYRDARRAAGLTGCIACKDTGKISQGRGSGAGRYGFVMTTLPCYACFWDGKKQEPLVQKLIDEVAEIPIDLQNEFDDESRKYED